jgi:hypothetical protein
MHSVETGALFSSTGILPVSSSNAPGRDIHSQAVSDRDFLKHDHEPGSNPVD